MKLIIKRDQKQEKGLLGGHKGMRFLLSCRIELIQEESDLISMYKAEDEFTAAFNLGERSNPQVLWRRDLVVGKTFECKDVLSLLKAEDEIKQACNNFKTLLTVMASFGGEEAIEF